MASPRRRPPSAPNDAVAHTHFNPQIHADTDTVPIEIGKDAKLALPRRNSDPKHFNVQDKIETVAVKIGKDSKLTPPRQNSDPKDFNVQGKIETVAVKIGKDAKLTPPRQNSDPKDNIQGKIETVAVKIGKEFPKACDKTETVGVKIGNETFPKISDIKSEIFAVKISDPKTKVNIEEPKKASPPKKIVSPPQRVFLPKETTPPPKVTSPPVLISKQTRVNSIVDEKSVVQKTFKPDVLVVKDIPKPVPKTETVVSYEPVKPASIIEPEKPAITNEPDKSEIADLPPPVSELDNAAQKNDESNGVGDKIKIFEKAAENAATVGRLSRSGSMRRPRTERLPSDELPPPPTELSLSPAPSAFERQPSLPRNDIGSINSRWPRSDGESDVEPPKPRPEPQRIIRPEFRPLASPAEVTIRSPSLGVKIPDRFPSHGTAFRNVAATPPALNRELPTSAEESDEHHKACKSRKDRYSVSRGSSYFTRGSEEIWLVKKKDIEEIEERVLDSFRRSGPPSGNGGAQTLGRGRRQMYARSESLEPTSTGPRAQTLKRQSSVACTCGHDKKTRARSADSTAPRLRSRSHGDDNNHAHVLDKYETLV